MIGKVIGNYRIVEKIGEGGMGAVFRGLDTMLEREVAIKMLRPELSSQPEVVERFRTEAVTLAKLNHPNIATLFSFLREGEDHFMVMEFVRGETLDDMIRRFGAMNVERAVPLFCQALDGIDHAHRMGIIHRDIKPANMMLTESGSIKVMDFGIARVLGSARLTRQGNVVGTIEYMSPEAVRGIEVDARSDVYSLGILLYELLTGRVPFDSGSEFEMMRAQVEQAPAPPRTFTSSIPIEVEQAIMRSLAKKPEARFQTAGEFRMMLLGALGTTTSNLQTHTGNYAAPITRAMQVPVEGGTRTLGAEGDAVRGTRVVGSPGDTYERQHKPTLESEGTSVAAPRPAPAATLVANGVANGGHGAVQGVATVPPAEAEAAGAAQALPKRGGFGWKVYSAAAVMLIALVGVPVAFVVSRSHNPAPAAATEQIDPSSTSAGSGSGDENNGVSNPAETPPAANSNSATFNDGTLGTSENANANSNSSKSGRARSARNQNGDDTAAAAAETPPAPEHPPAHTDSTPKPTPDPKATVAQDSNKNVSAKPDEKKKKGGIGGFFKKIFGGGDDNKKKDESKNKNP
jgi:serine/threonine-protein kinase